MYKRQVVTRSDKLVAENKTLAARVKVVEDEAATAKAERQQQVDAYDAVVANRQRVVWSAANDTSTVIAAVVASPQQLDGRFNRERLSVRCDDVDINRDAQPGDDSSSEASNARSDDDDSDDNVPLSNMTAVGGSN